MADGHMIYIKRGSHFLALVWLVVGALLLPQPPALGDLDIRFDYRYDTRGFFSGANIERRQILEAAAATFEERISSTPPSITPSGINRWTLSIRQSEHRNGRHLNESSCADRYDDCFCRSTVDQ